MRPKQWTVGCRRTPGLNVPVASAECGGQSTEMNGVFVVSAKHVIRAAPIISMKAGRLLTEGRVR